MQIVEAVAAEAERQGAARVEAVHLRIGALTGIDKRALAFSWELAAAGTAAEGSRLEFEEVPLVVACPSCGGERKPASNWQLACPECPNAEPRIVSGRELQLTAMELPA